MWFKRIFAALLPPWLSWPVILGAAAAMALAYANWRGRKTGAQDVTAKANEQTLEAVRKRDEISRESNDLGRAALIERMRRKGWVRRD